MATRDVVRSSVGKDPIAEGILDVLTSAIQQLDSHVRSVRESQLELGEHIDHLATELRETDDRQTMALDLDPYVKKLVDARRKAALVNCTLTKVQERLRRLSRDVAKGTARRKTPSRLEAPRVFPSSYPFKP